MPQELIKRILSSIILIPLSLFFIVKGSVFLLFFFSLLFLTTVYEWNYLIKKNNLLRFLGILFLIFSFYLGYLLRVNFGLNTFLLVIIICVFTDIGGYIFGKIFKGPKLTKIIPNKTYTGMIGSFILSLISALIFSEYQNLVSAYDYLTALKINYFYYIFFILFISSLSQIGDLIISYFKRLAKLKNTGKLLPGHGGLLDRLDGIILAVPTSYILLKYLV